MYDRDNDIERLLMEENREKKRTASGVFHRASRLGYIRGGIKTQVDYLKGKEKKKYMGNGEVMESNIYDDVKNLPTLAELESMNPEKAKHILTRAKMNNSARAIHEQLKVSNGKLYSLFDKFGVEYGKYKMSPGSFKTKDKGEGEIINMPGLEPKPTKGIESLPSLDELKNMNHREASAIVAAAKKTYSLKTLRKHWGVTDYMLYNHIFPKYGIGAAKRPTFEDMVEETLKSKTKDQDQIIFTQTLPLSTTATLNTTSTMTPYYNATLQPTEVVQEKAHNPYDILKAMEDINEKLKVALPLIAQAAEDKKPKVEETGYSIKVNDIYTAKAIQNRMMNILATLDESFKYKVEIKIIELDEVKVINE